MTDNRFSFNIPLEVTEKADDTGWRIKGICSTEDKDLQGEIVKQDGLDWSYVDKGLGLFNWNHKNDPVNLLGKIDKHKKLDGKTEVEGYLFKHQDQSKAIVNIMRSLKPGDKGRIQMSIEGAIKERAGEGNKIIKNAIIEKIALTVDAVNRNTYTQLVKSLTALDAATMEQDLAKSVTDTNEKILAESGELIEVNPEIISKNEPAIEERIEKALAHKYIRREGTPGNYKYYYKDESGKEYSTAKEPSEEHIVGATSGYRHTPQVLTQLENKITHINDEIESLKKESEQYNDFKNEEHHTKHMEIYRKTKSLNAAKALYGAALAASKSIQEAGITKDDDGLSVMASVRDIIYRAQKIEEGVKVKKSFSNEDDEDITVSKAKLEDLVNKATELSKMLTAGYAYENAPGGLSGGAAISQEDLDMQEKILTWGQGDLKRLKVKVNKLKEKAFTEEDKKKEDYITKPAKKSLMDDEYRDLFKSVLFKFKTLYPAKSIHEIADITQRYVDERMEKAAKGSTKSGHKWIKREGAPGNYKYWYKDPKTGEVYQGDESGKRISGGGKKPEPTKGKEEGADANSPEKKMEFLNSLKTDNPEHQKKLDEIKEKAKASINPNYKTDEKVAELEAKVEKLEGKIEEEGKKITPEERKDLEARHKDDLESSKKLEDEKDSDKKKDNGKERKVAELKEKAEDFRDKGKINAHILYSKVADMIKDGESGLKVRRYLQVERDSAQSKRDYYKNIMDKHVKSDPVYAKEWKGKMDAQQEKYDAADKLMDDDDINDYYNTGNIKSEGKKKYHITMEEHEAERKKSGIDDKFNKKSLLVNLLLARDRLVKAIK